MAVKYFYADSLEEYIKCIGEIEDLIIKDNQSSSSDTRFSKDKPPVLWFRGLSHIDHTLIPALCRTDNRVETLGDIPYSRLHYSEDIRTQHYIAKNYHFFDMKPSSRIEWLEVMQHHGVKTRMLDWSESSVHSLLFALECFLDNNRFNTLDRQKCVPCVWVMNPQGINREIFQMIIKDNVLIRELLGILDFTPGQMRQIRKHINLYEKDLESTQIIFEDKNISHLDYIVNLSALNDDYIRNVYQIKKLLLRGEIIPLIYYLIIRIYSEGKILEDRTLPPLCIVNPYHSERIKAQRGVFTVFPFYKEHKIDAVLRAMNIVPDAMENNKVAQNYLYKIILMKPQKIIEQMLANGMDDSWLYPERPIAAGLIENHSILK